MYQGVRTEIQKAITGQTNPTNKFFKVWDSAASCMTAELIKVSGALSFVIQLHDGIAQHQQQILHGVMHFLDHSRIGLSNSDSSMGLVPEKLRIYPENDCFNGENDDEPMDFGISHSKTHAEFAGMVNKRSGSWLSMTMMKNEWKPFMMRLWVYYFSLRFMYIHLFKFENL